MMEGRGLSPLLPAPCGAGQGPDTLGCCPSSPALSPGSEQCRGGFSGRKTQGHTVMTAGTRERERGLWPRAAPLLPREELPGKTGKGSTFRNNPERISTPLFGNFVATSAPPGIYKRQGLRVYVTLFFTRCCREPSQTANHWPMGPGSFQGHTRSQPGGQQSAWDGSEQRAHQAKSTVGGAHQSRHSFWGVELLWSEAQVRGHQP